MAIRSPVKLPYAVDKSTGAQISIDYAHHEVHGGSHYYVEGFTTLATGASLLVKLVTPNTTKWSHFNWHIESNGFLETYLYEDASGGMAGGATITPLNNNRNSSNTSGMMIVSGVATPTTYVTTISQKSWGGTGFKTTSGGGSGREDELVLKQDATYCRTFVSGSDDNIVSFKAFWYEHTNK